MHGRFSRSDMTDFSRAVVYCFGGVRQGVEHYDMQILTPISRSNTCSGAGMCIEYDVCGERSDCTLSTGLCGASRLARLVYVIER